jgi:hypothetical protein
MGGCVVLIIRALISYTLLNRQTSDKEFVYQNAPHLLTRNYCARRLEQEDAILTLFLGIKSRTMRLYSGRIEMDTFVYLKMKTLEI